MQGEQNQSPAPQPLDRLNRWLLKRVGLGMLAASVAIFVLSALLVQHGFAWIERDRMQERLERAAGTLRASAQAMVSSTRDYAGWDETHVYFTQDDPGYLARNFTDDSTRNLGIDWVAAVALDGRLIDFLTVRNYSNGDTVRSEFSQKLPVLSADYVRGSSEEEGHALLWLAGRPTLVSHAAVTDTARSQPAAGWLYFGRDLDTRSGTSARQLSDVPVAITAAPNQNMAALDIRPVAGLWVGRKSLAPWPASLTLQEPPAYSQRQAVVLGWIAIGMVGLVVLALAGFGVLVRRKVIARLEHFVTLSHGKSTREGVGVRWPVVGNDEIDQLAGSFNGMMERIDHHERVLVHLASHDQLTELGNRRHLMQHLRVALEQQRLAPESTACLVIVDIDRFKAINDLLGHSAGDQVLAAVAERIRCLIRKDDIAARLGGDEFAVLLADTVPEQGLLFCDKLNERISQGIPHAGELLFCSVSMGVAALAEGLDERSVLHHADQAMYQAKRQGSGRIVVFDATFGDSPVQVRDSSG